MLRLSNFSPAAVFPGQAILLSQMMDVFTLTGDAMTDRGDFFASMFIVMAAGCLVFYFGLGWAVNVVAQVCILLFILKCGADHPDPFPQTPQADTTRHASSRSTVF